jgi:protein phosphatase
VRENNEDNLLIAAPLYAVADGMGGHAAGEVASEIAIQTLLDAQIKDVDPVALRDALVAANHAIIEAADQGVGRMGMGTTMTAAVIRENRLLIAQVGDSRAYLMHAGRLRQVTRDHSLMAELIALGEVTPTEARTHPQRSVITRVLGSELHTLPDLYEIDIVNGDRLLLCSDGLTGMVDDEEIESLLAAHPDPQSAADALVEAARAAGGYDNVTVVLVEIDGTDLTARRQRTVRARRGVIAFLLAFVLIVGGIVAAFVALAANSYFVIDEGGIVQAYRGFPGEIAGIELKWPLELEGDAGGTAGAPPDGAGTGGTAGAQGDAGGTAGAQGDGAGTDGSPSPSPSPSNDAPLLTSSIHNPTVVQELLGDGIRLDSPAQVEAWFAEQRRAARP